MAQLFENRILLRGFLGQDAEVSVSDSISEDGYAVLTLCMDSGAWWRPEAEWISRTVWYRVVCPGPYFYGFVRGMKRGEYVEIEGEIVIHHYDGPGRVNPVYEICATQIRRLEIPAVGVIETYNG